MNNDEKKRRIKNYDAEIAESFESLGTASYSEATGLMYAPPRSESELRSREQLFTMQVDMPPEGYVGNEREWRSDIERYYRDESKPVYRDEPESYFDEQEAEVITDGAHDPEP